MKIVANDDPHWWQAKSETTQKVGLIPSIQLQEKRAAKKSLALRKKSPSPTSPPRNRRLPIMYEAHACDEFDAPMVLTYEEVGRLYPREDFCRPVVLIGAPGVGRNELKRRLLLLNPNRFGTTVPHTSRQPKPGEVDGVEYRFVSRAEMEKWAGEGLLFFVLH